MAFNFSKLKNIFVVTEEDNKQKQEPEKKQETKQPEQKVTAENKSQTDNKKSSISWKINNPTNTEVPISQINTTISAGEYDQASFDLLMKAMAKANLPGEDYFEFAEAIKAMKDIPLDENIKVQTVIATLSTKGLTLKTVIDSADYYLKVLQNEKDNFYQAFNSKKQGMITEKQQSVENLEKQIKNKTIQIAQLTDEINKSHEEILKIKNEIAESDALIKSKENNFLFTFGLVEKQINDNIKKIQTIYNK